MKYILTLLVVAAAFSASAQKYGFSFFRDNGQAGVYIAVSDDGLSWREANGGKPVMVPPFDDKLTRDPSICVGPDKTYHMVWTCGWWSKGFGVAHSKDLVNWTDQKFVPAITGEPAALNTWAPEIAYDKTTAKYYVFWATTVTNKFLETAGRGDGVCNHRIYCVSTKDFSEWSPRQLVYDGGFNVIDAFPFQKDGRWGMVVKDETLKPVAKNLHIVWSSGGISGPWEKAGPAFTDNTKAWAEGPSVLKVPDGWLVYFDEYNKGGYGAVRTHDFVTFTPVAATLPKGIRHGTTFELAPGTEVR